MNRTASVPNFAFECKENLRTQATLDTIAKSVHYTHAQFLKKQSYNTAETYF